MAGVIVLAGFGGPHAFGTRGWAPASDSVATLRQVHSNRVIAVERAGIAGEGDALISNTAGLLLSIRTADCYPILLADRRTGAVAAIHAGWRGTAAGIVGETMRAMRERFGTEPRDVEAAIGPGIGVCCYEVGEEVGREFGLEGRGKVDLLRANREQLIASGVGAEKIGVVGRCTFCEAEVFESFRREGARAGRMISVIGVAERS